VAIVFGVFTPTEAAGVFSALYAYLVQRVFFTSKSISLKDLPKIFTETLKLSCLSLFVLWQRHPQLANFWVTINQREGFQFSSAAFGK